MQIETTPILMPENADIKPLLGFDCHDGLYHLVAFDFGNDGALGILREGDNFCARISLDAVAEFWRQAKAEHKTGHG